MKQHPESHGERSLPLLVRPFMGALIVFLVVSLPMATWIRNAKALRKQQDYEAIEALRLIFKSQHVYIESDQGQKYGTLEDLAMAGLISGELGRGEQNGYRFKVVLGEGEKATYMFSVSASPVDYPGDPESRHFYVDQFARIRINHGKPATRDDFRLAAELNPCRPK